MTTTFVCMPHTIALVLAGLAIAMPVLIRRVPNWSPGEEKGVRPG